MPQERDYQPTPANTSETPAPGGRQRPRLLDGLGGHPTVYWTFMLPSGLLAGFPELTNKLFNIQTGTNPTYFLPLIGTLSLFFFGNLHRKQREISDSEATTMKQTNRISELEEIVKTQDASAKTIFQAIEASVPNLHNIANMSPDDDNCKLYVNMVMRNFQSLLEPAEEPDECIRICLYRISSLEERDVNKPSHETQFHLYSHVKGHRRDSPREKFTNQEPPGSYFIDRLLTNEIVENSNAKPHDDDERYSNGTQQAYGSYVNILVVDKNQEPLAMLSADCKHKDFFDDERVRLVRILSLILSVALFSELNEKAPSFSPDTLKRNLAHDPSLPSKLMTEEVSRDDV